jgi:hypothetical protein
VLSVLRLTASDYPFGIFWLLCCLSFCDWQLLITHLVSCGHCVVCPAIDSFWLPIWYLLAIVLFVLLWLTGSNYPFGIFWSLCCLSFCDLQLLITHVVSFGHCVVCPAIDSLWLPIWYGVAIVLSVLLRLTASDYPFVILWLLCCLSFCDWQLLISHLVSCGHCVVCPFVIDSFRLPIWYLLAIVLSVLLWLTASDYPFGILWPLCCLSCDWQLLVTHLVFCVHCVVCPSVVDSFWLPIWYLQAVLIMLI